MHPKEMFEMFANFFVEDTYNKTFVSCLKPGTKFLLSSQMNKSDEEPTDDNYVVGYVSSKTPRIFCKDKQNTFNPICIPYVEYAECLQDKIKNRYIRN